MCSSSSVHVHGARYVDENLRMLATEVEKACFSEQPRSRLNLGSALQSVKALL